MTTLDDTQKKQIAAWIGEGLKLSDIQKRIESEFGLRLTYMETRFLLDDLALAPKDPDAEIAPKSQEEAGSAEAGQVPGGEPPAAQGPETPAGGVTVSVDHLVRSGALISGQVVFSDGKKAAWYLDQFGRLGLIPEEKGTKPSESDLREFQMQLQSILEKSAY